MLDLDLSCASSSTLTWSFCISTALVSSWPRSRDPGGGIDSIFLVVTELPGAEVANSWAFGRSTCPRSREGSMISRTSFFSVLVSEMSDRMLSCAADKEEKGRTKGTEGSGVEWSGVDKEWKNEKFARKTDLGGAKCIWF